MCGGGVCLYRVGRVGRGDLGEGGEGDHRGRVSIPIGFSNEL